MKIAKHKDPSLCQAYRCKEKKAPHKKFCNKHHARYQKQTNPTGYHYNLLKQNAKRRGKDFSLTLEEFREFCRETNYIELKGKHSKDMSIDRIDSSKGYEKNNIQIMSLGENVRKQRAEEAFENPPAMDDEKDLPF